MSALSHVAVGFLITRFFVDRGWLPDNSITPYLLGIAFANLPDIDGLLSLKRLYNHQNHFKSVFHYPANWLIVLALTALLVLIFPVRFGLSYIALATVSILLHFILDTFSIYGGIAWLWPWKKRRFSFIRRLQLDPSNNHEWIKWYTKHWVMYLEIALWIASLIVLVG